MPNHLYGLLDPPQKKSTESRGGSVPNDPYPLVKSSTKSHCSQQKNLSAYLHYLINLCNFLYNN